MQSRWLCQFHIASAKEALRRLKAGLVRAGANFVHLFSIQEIWKDDHLQFRVGALGQVPSLSIAVAEKVPRRPMAAGTVPAAIFAARR
jgi:hypothetical protein